MIPFTVWLLDQRELKVIKILWIFICAAGLAVMASYGIEAIIDLKWDKKQGAEREQLLSEQLKERADGSSK